MYWHYPEVKNNVAQILSEIPASLFLREDDPERSGAGALTGEAKRQAKHDAAPNEPCPYCGRIVELGEPFQVIARRRWHQACNDENISLSIAQAVLHGTHSTNAQFLCEYCGEVSPFGHYSVSWQDRKYMCPDCAKRNGENVPEHLLKGFVPFDPALYDDVPT